MGASNCVLGCLNSITLCLSLPILVAGHLLKLGANSPCDPIMYKPLLILGTCLVLISLIGLLGAFCRLAFFQWLYVFTLFILIIGLLACLSVGAVVIRGDPKGENVLGDVKEYQLPKFSSWMKATFIDAGRWEDVEQCMIRHDACGKIGQYKTIMNFVILKQSKLTSIEGGCCKPPIRCGYEYENATNWRVPTKGLTSEDQDCKAWNNDSTKLCYNCETCKAGYLALFIQGWRKIIALNIILLLVLFFVFVIAVCSLRC